MARTVDGVSSILKGARILCRSYNRFGAAGLIARATPEFAAAVATFVAACAVFEALDDQPTVIDRENPEGPEDIVPISA